MKRIAMARTERDFLGKMRIPDKAYYGIQTARAAKNFQVSGIRSPEELIHAYVTVKKAAALANMKLGTLDRKRGRAIVAAADEILKGRHLDQFIVDVFQAGAGTSTNMNVNEVLANLALEKLGRAKGNYEFLNPNDHVNMAQSSNDTYPTASHIAVLIAGGRLLEVLDLLGESFKAKAREFRGIRKSGRTHLMDALPIRLGDEFRAYATSIARASRRLRQRWHDLEEVAIGGTAVGTGANAPRGYRKTVIEFLRKLTGFRLRPARDAFEALQSRASLGAFSSALKELALELIRIANDLRLLSSGPITGLSEIELPAVQPGSSIMPGKVNPVMAECLDMLGFQIVGNDLAVTLALQAGQLEMNVMVPVITYNVLSSIRMLNSFLPVFLRKCVKGIKANKDRCEGTLARNPAVVTLLAPKIGYAKAAEMWKKKQIAALKKID